MTKPKKSYVRPSTFDRANEIVNKIRLEKARADLQKSNKRHGIVSSSLSSSSSSVPTTTRNSKRIDEPLVMWLELRGFVQQSHNFCLLSFMTTEVS
jgi:hypothetical protein